MVWIFLYSFRLRILNNNLEIIITEMLVVLKILGFYSLLIIILGILSNISTIFFCTKIKENTTFVLIQYFSLNNLIALFFWNLSHFTLTFFDFDLNNSTMFICKFGSWIQFSSLQTSAWILVN